MTDKVCSIDGCGKPYRARGWCNRHWLKWSRHGDPLAGTRLYATPQESFAARTERSEDGCLIWTGSKQNKGYGWLAVSGKNVLAHRFAWSEARGAIPDGMVIDHMCFNRACVEVDHLRLVTSKQNAENQRGARADSATGIRGVYWSKWAKKWHAQIRHRGENVHLGYFLTAQDAERAAKAARAELFTHSQN